MKIAIVGAGEVGVHIASSLRTEGHDLVVIERDGKKVAELQSSLDILAVKGAELILAPYCIPAGYLSSEHNTEHTSAPGVAGEEFLDHDQ